MNRPQVRMQPGEYLITLYTEVVPEDDGEGWAILNEQPLGVHYFSGHAYTEQALTGFACSRTNGLISPQDIGPVEIEEGSEIYCLCSAEDGRPILEVSLH